MHPLNVYAAFYINVVVVFDAAAIVVVVYVINSL
jgi:hypothetical protein